MKENKASVIDFFCIGFGAIVGVGWAVSINNWMSGSGGPLPAAAGYIMALVLMIPVALCYCELCSMLPVSGGGMAYAFRAFGDNIAFVSGWAAFGAFITIIPWEAIYVVDILSILVPVLKSGVPLYTLAGADIYPGHIIVGTVISIVLYRINRRGVAASASLQRFLCLALVGAGILAMICAGVKMDVSNFTPAYENIGSGSHTSFFGGACAILASVPFFLAGFETIPQGIESAGGDKKGIGKTVVLTVVLSCFFYALLLVTLGGALPWKEFVKFQSPAAANLFTVVYPGTMGKMLYVLILVGAICGLITTWNGFMMASSQILMAMARVSILPYSLSKQHKEFGTPINALKVSLVASLLGPFLGSGLIGSLTTFSAAGYVVSWLITAFCLIKLRKTEPELERPYLIPGGTKTAWFAGICMSVLLVLLFIPKQPVFIGGFATLLFFGWMAIGAVLYILDYRQRREYSVMKRSAILFASMSAAVLEGPGFFEHFEIDYKVLSFVVPKDAEYAGQTLFDLRWGQRQNILVVKIDRGTKMHMLPNGFETVEARDHVFIVGSERMIGRFLEYQDVGDKYTITDLKTFMGFGAVERQSPLVCEEFEITGEESFAGKMIKESKIQSNFHCVVVGLHRGSEDIIMPEADAYIMPGDSMWLVGSEEDLETYKLAEPIREAV